MLAFLKSLPVNIELTYAGRDWLLVHGSPECQYERKWFKYESSVEYAVWNRIKEWDYMPEGKTVIFGHTPVFHYQYDVPPQIYRREDRIGIDCGCAYDDRRIACV